MTLDPKALEAAEAAIAEIKPQHAARHAILAYLAALPAASATPGWKLVPVEPTMEMMVEGGERIVREYAESDWEGAKDMAEELNPAQIYTAMVAAAPEPPPPSSGACPRKSVASLPALPLRSSPMAERLTETDRAELRALARFNDRLGGPFFTMRCNWRDYAGLVRRGLVAWTDPPRPSARRMFAGVEITPAGRAALAEEEGR